MQTKQNSARAGTILFQIGTILFQIGTILFQKWNNYVPYCKRNNFVLKVEQFCSKTGTLMFHIGNGTIIVSCLRGRKCVKCVVRNLAD